MVAEWSNPLRAGRSEPAANKATGEELTHEIKVMLSKGEELKPSPQRELFG